MKKIILHCFLCVFAFAFITSCSKDVKVPVKPVTNAASKTTTTTTTTTTGTQGGHTCGGDSHYGGAGG